MQHWLRPQKRYMPAVADITWRGMEGMAIFGGESLPGSTKKSTLNDFWVFVPVKGGGWQRLFDNNCQNTPFVHADNVSNTSLNLDADENEDGIENQELDQEPGDYDDADEQDEHAMTIAMLGIAIAVSTTAIVLVASAVRRLRVRSGVREALL